MSTAISQADDENAIDDNELGSGSCTTLPATIHVTKDELDEAGNVVRVCEGDLQVSKCEGTCASQLKPSVGSPTGFTKVSVRRIGFKDN